MRHWYVLRTPTARSLASNFKLQSKWAVISSPSMTVVRHLIFESLSLANRTLWYCSTDARHSTLQCTFCALALLLRERQSSADRPYLWGLLIIEELVLWQSLVCSADYRDQVVYHVTLRFIKKNEWLEGVRDLLRSYSRSVMWSNNDAPKESWTNNKCGVSLNHCNSWFEFRINLEHLEAYINPNCYFSNCMR